MANLDFSASVDEWVKKTKERTEAVFKESTQRVIEEALLPRSKGGRMRVDTGFLRSSGQASLSAMPAINPQARPLEGQTYAGSFGDVTLTIAGAELGNTIYFGFTASYAAFREYGANGQAPDAFVRTAAGKWQQIVDKVTREAKGG